MTSNFVAEANKLKNIQANLERQEQTLLEHIKKYSDSKIVEFYEQLELERKKELNALQNEIINILSPLNKFKTLTLGSKIENLDYKQIKKDMLMLAEKIKYFSMNTKQYLQKLREEEHKYNEDIKAYENKLLDWEKHINISAGSYNKNIKNNKIEQNVTDFLTFLSKSGGHSNGWSSDDHNLFLKARAKCKDVNELCIYLHAILPDISEEEIQSHEKWYTKYLELKQKQRHAIKNWRKSKSAVVIKKQPTIEDNEKRATSAYTNDKNVTRMDMKEKLDKWKQEKNDKLEYEKILTTELEKRKRESEEKRRRKHEEIKKTIENWRSAKLEKEEMELFEKETVEKQQRTFKSAMANRLIKEFQSQDQIFLKKRIELCKPRAKSMERIMYNTIQIGRDPTRLLKPTKQWISRIKNVDNEHKLTMINPPNIRAVPKLGLPEWRKNASVTR